MKNKSYENEVIDIEELLEENSRKAQKMMKDPNKLDRLMKKLERKLQKLPAKLKGALVYIPRMAMLINSWIRREYTEIPIGSIAAIIGAIIYFVAPIDAVPDYVPLVGLLDDAGVVGAALLLVKSDVEDYMEWRFQMGLDETLAT